MINIQIHGSQSGFMHTDLQESCGTRLQGGTHLISLQNLFPSVGFSYTFQKVMTPVLDQYLVYLCIVLCPWSLRWHSPMNFITSEGAQGSEITQELCLIKLEVGNQIPVTEWDEWMEVIRLKDEFWFSNAVRLATRFAFNWFSLTLGDTLCLLVSLTCQDSDSHSSARTDESYRPSETNFELCELQLSVKIHRSQDKSLCILWKLYYGIPYLHALNLNWSSLSLAIHGNVMRSMAMQCYGWFSSESKALKAHPFSDPHVPYGHWMDGCNSAHL